MGANVFFDDFYVITHHEGDFLDKKSTQSQTFFVTLENKEGYFEFIVQL